MGMMTEGQIRDQVKKSGEATAARLDALIAEQRRTNQLLEALITAVRQRPLVPPSAPQGQPPASWGRQG